MTSRLCRGFDDLSFALKPDSRGAFAVEDQLVDIGMGDQAQIGAAERGLEKAPRRRPAQPALLVHMKISDAFIIAGVEVRGLRNSHLDRRVAHSVQDIPAQPGRFDPPFAFSIRDARCRPENDRPGS